MTATRAAARAQRHMVHIALGPGLRDDTLALERWKCIVCRAYWGDPIYLPLALTDRGLLYCNECQLDPVDVGQAFGPLLARNSKPVTVLADRRAKRDLGPVLDQLRSIPAPEYVRLLARVEVPDHGGTIHCPLPGHDDATPSFTVYAGDRGVWCHGCQRGGGLVDFAAALWDRPTSGAAFVDLVRDIGRALLIEVAA